MSRSLFLIAAASAAAVGLAVAAFGAGDATFWWIELAAQAVGAAGCLAAAAQLRRGDPLWNAWLAMGASFVLPVLDRLAVGPNHDWPAAGLFRNGPFNLGYGLLVNLAMVAAVLLFVRAFLAAGLDLGVSPRARTGAIVGSALAALAVGAPVLVLDLRASLASGFSPDAIFSAASVTADALCFAAVGPLALMARALRGGVLHRTWGLLAGANLLWLAYDVLFAASRFAPGVGWRVAEDVIVAVACVASAAAGLAHRAALRRVAAQAASAGLAAA